ncbi:hypothetical protein [uncultured Selenomonas sp.]|uniref:hypothetical protein n=1 Tax=uncultured Selenomonas sp. TaxID=159275 RepID=UPI0028E7D4CA|nr:hypothetical protein [uncultured Selenomonas sp.]
MKILVTIPHYYSHNPEGIYASNGDPKRKVENLRKLIVHLKTLFESPQAYCRYDLQNADGSRFTDADLQAGRPIARSLANYYAANEALHAKVDIVLSTAGERHVLDRLGLPQGMYERRDFSDVDPKLLGFTCQDVLKERRGEYDYYCYMEDDLVVHDPLFFQKLAWFDALFGAEAVLLPHRFEYNEQCVFPKGYVETDGFEAGSELVERLSFAQKYIDFAERPVLTAALPGGKMRFVKARNPHAGCFFLTAAQFELWLSCPYYGERTGEFSSTFESPATWGLIRTFGVYKSDFPVAAFFEIEHAGARFLGQSLSKEPQKRIDAASFAREGIHFSF